MDWWRARKNRITLGSLWSMYYGLSIWFWWSAYDQILRLDDRRSTSGNTITNRIVTYAMFVSFQALWCLEGRKFCQSKAIGICVDWDSVARVVQNPLNCWYISTSSTGITMLNVIKLISLSPTWFYLKSSWSHTFKSLVGTVELVRETGSSTLSATAIEHMVFRRSHQNPNVPGSVLLTGLIGASGRHSFSQIQ